MLTDERKQEIRARIDAVPEGLRLHLFQSGGNFLEESNGRRWFIPSYDVNPDPVGVLIGHAPADLADLLTRVDELEKALDVAHRSMGSMAAQIQAACAKIAEARGSFRVAQEIKAMQIGVKINGQPITHIPN